MNEMNQSAPREMTEAMIEEALGVWWKHRGSETESMRAAITAALAVAPSPAPAAIKAVPDVLQSEFNKLKENANRLIAECDQMRKGFSEVCDALGCDADLDAVLTAVGKLKDSEAENARLRGALHSACDLLEEHGLTSPSIEDARALLC